MFCLKGHRVELLEKKKKTKNRKKNRSLPLYQSLINYSVRFSSNW